MSSRAPVLILASRSPRRAALLRQLGLTFETIAADVDERPRPGEGPADYVMRLAVAKAAAAEAAAVTPAAGAVVVGADTAVVIDGDILGKPKDRDDAGAMLARLSGRTHEVLTAVAVAGRDERCVLSVTEVSFKPLTSAEIDAYLATDEPWDKAGAYAIQGRAARFVTRIAGSYSGVVGLPLFELGELIGDAGQTG